MQSTWERSAPEKDASEEDLLEYLRQLCSDVTLVSNKEGFFCHWTNQFSSYISTNFIEKFAKCSNDYQRVQLVWSVKPLHSLKVGEFYKSKNDSEAKKLKELGTKAFKDRKWQRALSLYSQAIVHADTAGKILSLCYANRSATLSQLNEFNYCLKDIRLTLVHGYPQDLQYKIFERAGFCYEKLKKTDHAEDCYIRSIKLLDLTKLTPEEKEKWTANIVKRLDKDWLKVTLPIEPIVKTDKGSYSAENEVERCASFSSLFGGVNKALPKASSAIALKSTTHEGRFAVSSTDIPVDSVLVKESPYASVLAKDKAGGFCSHCFRRLVSPVPCSSCRVIAYCCAECRDGASKSHALECRFGDLLSGSGISLNGYLALRMITIHPLDYFLKLRESLNQIETTKHPSNVPLPVPTENMSYDPTNYTSVYNLVGLESQRDKMDFLQRALMAVLLLKILQRAGYFGPWTEGTPDDRVATDEELYIGSLLLRNLQILQFNAHEVSGVVFSEEKSFQKCKSVYLGLGVYPTVAFFNHSCDPSVTRHFIGSEMVLSSVRNIKSGEMVAENYGPTFTHSTKEQRERKLLSRYWFRCGCVACEQDWPSYLTLNEEDFRYKCRSCSFPLRLSAKEQSAESGRSVKCQKCRKSQLVDELKSTTLQTDKLFKVAKKSMDDGERELAIKLYSRFISLSEETYVLPYKKLHLAVQALRLLVAARGSHCVIKTSQ